MALAAVSLVMLSACGVKTEPENKETSANTVNNPGQSDMPYQEVYLELIDAMYREGEADYEKTVDSFFASHGARTYLDTVEMIVCPYSKEKGCCLEGTAIPYMTYDEIVEELKKELPDAPRP